MDLFGVVYLILGSAKRRDASGALQSVESKKLTDAGYYLANSNSPQDEQDFDDDSAALGIVWEEPVVEIEDEHFTVFHDAWLAVETFISVQTQWLYSMDGITGLNYAGVLAVIALSTPKKSRLDLLHEVSAIERGYLKAVNEKREKLNRK